MSFPVGVRLTAVVPTTALDDALEAVAHRWAAHCLLELDGGRVAAHHVHAGPVPDAVVRAVLGKAIAPLAEGRRRLRTLGLSAGGAVVTGVAATGEALVSLPLGHAAEACLWLVGDAEVPVDLEELTRAGNRVLRAYLDGLDQLALDSASMTETLLAGAALPARVLGRARSLRLLGLLPSGDPLTVEAALRRCGEPHLSAGRCGDALLVALDDDEGAAVRSARRLVAALEAQGVDLRAALSTRHVGSTETARPRDQVLAGLQIAAPGTVLLVEEYRPALVLGQLTSSLAAAAALLGDPLEALDQATCRDVDFRGSLLTWLDAHGDARTAAERLGVHVNTLRYRVRRALELLGTDLSDPTERLEVHLRLRLAT
jgi:hypothetical protein